MYILYVVQKREILRQTWDETLLVNQYCAAET